MKLKKSSYYCLSQATPPLKNWLHSNKLRYLVLAASVFPMLGTQLYATTDNSLNQTTQSAQTNKVNLPRYCYRRKWRSIARSKHHL